MSTPQPLSRFEKYVSKMLFDPRDIVFVTLSLKVYALLVPLWLSVFFAFHWMLLGAYLLLALWYISPVILMLHNTMHRPFFRKAWLSRVHAYSMSFLFGIPTGYLEHHLGMHHVENNGHTDLSATIRFERDNFWHWIRYTSRFLFFIQFDLTKYLRSKRRLRMAARAISTDWVHMTLVLLVTWHDYRLGLLQGVGLMLLTRLAMMFGNWGQHAFVDPSRPLDSYANSITCINSLYNRRCFNDGYHIGHHVKPNRHWSELPSDFLANLERYEKEQCIVFEGVDFFMVSLLLFSGRYQWLERRMLRFPSDHRTASQRVEFLKARTRPLAAPAIDIALAGVA
jgi:fatty acid desaturase